MEAANEALRGQLDDLSATYEKTERELESLGDALNQRAREVGSVSGQALTKVEAWDRTLRERTEALTRASDDVAGRARDVAKAMDRQVKDLKEASREAASLAESLKARTDQAGADDFLRSAAFILEGLQSVAVDMNRLMEATISEDDWRRFNKGEKGIFVRKLLGFREKAKLAAIKRKYQEDGDFRGYVTRYLTQFEGLLKEARKRDHDGVLGTTLLSSEMGKVYMLLERALGRRH